MRTATPAKTNRYALNEAYERDVSKICNSNLVKQSNLHNSVSEFRIVLNFGIFFTFEGNQNISGKLKETKRKNVTNGQAVANINATELFNGCQQVNLAFCTTQQNFWNSPANKVRGNLCPSSYTESNKETNIQTHHGAEYSRRDRTKTS